MNEMIQVQHLSKRFGEVKAVNDLTFRVKEGELFAFLGVNGAGKSTTDSKLYWGIIRLPYRRCISLWPLLWQYCF